MIGILICGHGSFASGMRSALELICGPQEYLSAIDFTSLAGTRQLEHEVSAAYRSMSGCDGILVLCDFVSGMPFKACVTLAQGRKGVRVVAGVSLAGLVEGVSARDELDVDRLVERVLNATRDGTVRFGGTVSGGSGGASNDAGGAPNGSGGESSDASVGAQDDSSDEDGPDGETNGI